MAASKPRVKYITMADNPRGDVMACLFRCDGLAWVELQKMGLWQFIVIGKYKPKCTCAHGDHHDCEVHDV